MRAGEKPDTAFFERHDIFDVDRATDAARSAKRS